MDPFSGLRSEIFRPLATVVLPGLVAIMPYAILITNATPDIAEFAQDHNAAYVACAIAAATLAGLLLENIGTSIERGIDRCMEVEYLPTARIVWRNYLECMNCDSNARRYLGTIVTRMKFLNSFMPAIMSFAIGLVALQVQVKPWAWSSVLASLAGIYLLLVWMFRTSTELSEVAVSTQHRILLANDIASELDTEAHSVRRYRHFAYVVVEVLTSRIDEVDLRMHDGLKILREALLVSVQKVFPKIARNRPE